MIAYAKQNQIILSYSFPSSTKNSSTRVRDVQWFPSGVELLFVANDPSGVNQLYRIRRNGIGKIQMTENTTGTLNDVKLHPTETLLYTLVPVQVFQSFIQ